MGWTGVPQSQVKPSRKAFLRREFEQDGADRRIEVLIDAMVGADWYAAIAVTDKATGKREVMGLVALTRRSEGEVAYKDMTEDMGPYAFRCPVSILDYLDTYAPNPGFYGRQWRAKCREFHASKATGLWAPSAYDASDRLPL